ncbi:MAG TPA: hypothetical protein DEF07_02600 [Nitrosomonas sp.]|nr:hypothetical protein [Nitrosomonas sp.]
MNSLKFLLALTLCLVVFSANIQAKPSQSSSSSAFEFALIGDVPHDAKDLWKFDNVVKEINSDKKLNWVLALQPGDIRNIALPCTDERFENHLDRFQQFEIPLILTPENIEWTNCHHAFDSSRPLERRYDTTNLFQPSERLARLREIFYPEPVKTQTNDPAYSESAENMHWMKNHILFATINIDGSNNAQAVDGEAGTANATLTWIQEVFKQAKAHNARGVFLLFEANPADSKENNPGRAEFKKILTAFERESVKYGKPVVLAHSGSSYFRMNQSMSGSTGNQKTENVINVKTFDADEFHWLRVTVNPESKKVFTIHREIVEKNLEHHSSIKQIKGDNNRLKERVKANNL